MSKKLPTKTVTLLYGLPGSGKTTYAKSQEGIDGYKPTTDILDVDSITRYVKNNSYPGDTVVRHVGSDTVGKLKYREHIIIDGLVTNCDIAKRFFEAIQKEAKDLYKITFNLVWWTPDRENCLWNDQGRRGESSTFTIKNASFEEPTEALIKEFKLHVVRKEVIRKPFHKAWAVQNDLGDQDTLESDSWCLGGSHSDREGGTHYTSPSTPPTCFEEFDKLLEKVCPTISFLQYKKLYAATVKVKETSQSDYYAGVTNYAQYVCDLKKLYEMLTDLGVIK